MNGLDFNALKLKEEEVCRVALSVSPKYLFPYVNRLEEAHFGYDIFIMKNDRLGPMTLAETILRHELITSCDALRNVAREFKSRCDHLDMAIEEVSGFVEEDFIISAKKIHETALGALEDAEEAYSFASADLAVYNQDLMNMLLVQFALPTVAEVPEGHSRPCSTTDNLHH